MQLVILNVEDADFRDMLFDYRVTQPGTMCAARTRAGLLRRQARPRAVVAGTLSPPAASAPSSVCLRPHTRMCCR
jgi:hypothetical protein